LLEILKMSTSQSGLRNGRIRAQQHVMTY